ncbi:MAG: hypothetical protein EOO88_18705 [Pedobacter sp.]|nr:MAG: hypothetical protein EOO88_18705 [Pedobacter sp.]
MLQSCGTGESKKKDVVGILDEQNLETPTSYDVAGAKYFYFYTEKSSAEAVQTVGVYKIDAQGQSTKAKMFAADGREITTEVGPTEVVVISKKLLVVVYAGRSDVIDLTSGKVISNLRPNNKPYVLGNVTPSLKSSEQKPKFYGVSKTDALGMLYSFELIDGKLVTQMFDAGGTTVQAYFESSKGQLFVNTGVMSTLYTDPVGNPSAKVQLQTRVGFENPYGDILSLDTVDAFAPVIEMATNKVLFNPNHFEYFKSKSSDKTVNYFQNNTTCWTTIPPCTKTNKNTITAIAFDDLASVFPTYSPTTKIELYSDSLGMQRGFGIKYDSYDNRFLFGSADVTVPYQWEQFTGAIGGCNFKNYTGVGFPKFENNVVVIPCREGLKYLNTGTGFTEIVTTSIQLFYSYRFGDIFYGKAEQNDGTIAAKQYFFNSRTRVETQINDERFAQINLYPYSDSKMQFTGKKAGTYDQYVVGLVDTAGKFEVLADTMVTVGRLTGVE